MIPYNFYLATDEQTNKRKKSPNAVPPACCKAGVQTARELIIEETMLMDYEEPNTEETRNEAEIEKHDHTSTAENSEDEEPVTPFQVHRDTSPSLHEPSEQLLSDDVPTHIFGDLSGYWRSHSYFRSRVQILQGFAENGPFPSITNFRFQDDPHTGPTRKCARELDDATQKYKETICKVHARNYASLAVGEIPK